MSKQKIGVIGVGVMGKSLALNFESKGFPVSLFDVNTETTKAIVEKHKNKDIIGTYTVKEFIDSLESPKKIMLMVPAGDITDKAIESLQPYLSKGDILIDGGNSFFEDTRRRNEALQSKGINFIGAGVSGGEEGALYGPAIMPGGQKDAYEKVRPMLEGIAAKVDGEPCCTYIGPDGAGHYVKMVHNGIEYGDMQLICEAYTLMDQVLNLTTEELHHVFKEWNEGELDSYLVKITADIFTKKDEDTGKPLIDVILDTAGQKGTGKWTSQDAIELGVPLPIITESVFSRFISSLKDQRLKASKVLGGPTTKPFEGNKQEVIEAIRKSLYMSKICSYAQGFAQYKAASDVYDWDLQFGDIAMIFRDGCIIRAGFLQNIKDAYDRDPHLDNLLLDSYFKTIAENYQSALRSVISMAVQYGVPVPALSSALAYYDSYRSARLPANLLQAQRDYFGAHTYQRIDKEGTFHTDWLSK